jgi:caa(3)-type oxidase subunit IV
MANSPEEVAKHIGLYLKIGALLLVFTAITVFLSYVDFGSHSNNMIIGLGVATFKTCLVVLIFMHMNHERPLIYKFMLFAIVLVGVLFSLFIYAHDDPLTKPETMAIFEKPAAAHAH